jgi:hypothetical protein
MYQLELPSRRSQQSLSGYVREHLPQLEHELFAGVRYDALLGAACAAGFGKIPLRSLHSAIYRARRKRTGRRSVSVVRPVGRSRVIPPSEGGRVSPGSKDERALLARQFRELGRLPTPGTDEIDPLV